MTTESIPWAYDRSPGVYRKYTLGHWENTVNMPSAIGAHREHTICEWEHGVKILSVNAGIPWYLRGHWSTVDVLLVTGVYREHTLGYCGAYVWTNGYHEAITWSRACCTLANCRSMTTYRENDSNVLPSDLANNVMASTHECLLI